jgi:hypothetical protein
MIEISDEQGLKNLFEQKYAILFFHAAWSQYAVIGKQMIEFVETYAKMGNSDMVPAKMRQSDLAFFFIQPDEAPAQLSHSLVAAGVPRAAASVGNGSLSFFRNGQHVYTMRSVVSEGTSAVYKHIHEIFPRN